MTASLLSSLTSLFSQLFDLILRQRGTVGHVFVSLVFILVPAAAQSATLNMVAVGINRYRYPGMDLNYAVNDARDIATALRGNRLFTRADVNLLSDSQATVQNITNALTLLERRANAGTYSVLFLSGHGTRDAAGYFLYPTFDYNPRNAAATSISGTLLQSRLRRLPGRVFLIIDACHSGSAGIGRANLGPAAASNQFMVLGSSLSVELSQELGSVRNGAFTQALLEALAGAADQNNDRTVSLSEMHNYIYARVAKLTGNKQHAITFVPSQAFGRLTMSILPKAAPATGVVWQGRETLKGYGPLTFVLQNGGRAVMNDAKGQSIGTWAVSGTTLTLRFASGRVVYSGRVSGSSFSGTAANQATRWTFALARR